MNFLIFLKKIPFIIQLNHGPISVVNDLGTMLVLITSLVGWFEDYPMFFHGYMMPNLVIGIMVLFLNDGLLGDHQYKPP